MSREDLLKWPEQVSSQGSNLACASEFQTQYIDIIPEKWTAVSLALNEEHDELYITRYECGQTPFVLRLPMARHTNRDADEEEFTFDDGKRDFDEIIELSDFSTRSAKDMITQKLRLQWWEERDALDNRLRELLINMENIWLGGFKGIFSQHIRQPTLLARFRKSFENILDRHLPSRQAKKQPKKTILDTRVLELFIGLGDATNEELDLDEALMDLIYFVVDILQFNGERNAYDEIDFDAIVIETLDALRAYQDATQNNSTRTTHTILILDKNLHNIPWESLPCLQSLSISRLPSLAALRERILAAKASKDPGAQPGHYISVEAGGTSILNPSGDLTHTVKTLKPHLNEMQGSWTHIQSRAPTESEFESSLATQELVLYFGHGSGAQFVRSRSVRKLYPGEADREKRPGCATTFLFGCSSVHLSDNGIYEPSGMLASYLTAGAPAVVGMLWDVTDKDCDRFAVRAGELWGLWPESSETEVVPKTPGKGKKGKGKVSQLVEQVEGARGAGTAKKGGKRGGGGMLGEDVEMGEAKGMMRRIGLDEAVGQARDACVLRYLNGAAAVVYGIPVYLE
jgi:separase